MPSQEFAFVMAAGVACFSLGLSGGFVPFPMIQGFARWLQWGSPCKYALGGLALGVFKDHEQGEMILNATGLDNPSMITVNIGALFGMYGLLMIGSMLLLSVSRNQR